MSRSNPWRGGLSSEGAALPEVPLAAYYARQALRLPCSYGRSAERGEAVLRRNRIRVPVPSWRPMRLTGRGSR
jgi:hypothetical protein